MGHLEVVDAPLRLELLPVGAELGDHLGHAVDGVEAEGRVARVTGAPLDPDPVHEDALVHAHGHEPGRLADDRHPRLRLAVGQELTGAVHRALLVGGSDEGERRLQLARPEARRRGEGGREEALHVRAAEAVEDAVGALGELPGIRAPALGIGGHGVGVPAEHETALPFAHARDQVRLRRVPAQRYDLGTEADGLRPLGEAVDHPPVALIAAGVRAADGGLGDQRTNHGQGVGESHRLRTIAVSRRRSAPGGAAARAR